MKRLSYLLSTFLLMTLVVFSSCKDDTPEETLEQKQTRLLTAGAFNVQTVTLNPDTDYSFTGPTTITFSESNNTFTIAGFESLPKPANAPEGNFASGTWEWKDATNFDEVTLTSGTDKLDIVITSLDENSMVFTYTGAEPKPGDEVAVTVTATR